VGMQPVSTPQIVFLDNEPPEPPGISAFVILAESHVSFHTWPESGYVSLDIYSCKTFDVDKAERFILDFWKPKGEVNKQVVERR
jgi:S-adenosylmethionine decarboxylase